MSVCLFVLVYLCVRMLVLSFFSFYAFNQCLHLTVDLGLKNVFGYFILFQAHYRYLHILDLHVTFFKQFYSELCFVKS